MRNTVMIMTITTMMMTTRMPACNVCNHAHRLSFTDGPRKGEQASITMTATNALTNTYGGGASLGTPSSATRTQRGRRGECGPCAVGVALFFSPWGAMGSFHRTATTRLLPTTPAVPYTNTCTRNSDWHIRHSVRTVPPLRKTRRAGPAACPADAHAKSDSTSGLSRVSDSVTRCQGNVHTCVLVIR